MCGRYHVSSSPQVRKLLDQLGVSENPESRINIAPGALGQFVVQTQQGRSLVDGYWSLLIEPRTDGKPGFKPNPQYKTFNARSDRLQSSPLWKNKYRSKRAIVPADGFHEWVGKQCFDLRLEDTAIAFGGLYEEWQAECETVYSFAIITLPPHPRVAHIHDKSLPLMLEPEDFDVWLDPAFTGVDVFADLLKPVLRHRLLVTPVKSPKTLEAVGDVEVVNSD